MESWRNIQWMECNNPSLEVLETVTVISWFFGTKEKVLCRVRQIQGLFHIPPKRENFRVLWGKLPDPSLHTALPVSLRIFYNSQSWKVNSACLDGMEECTGKGFPGSRGEGFQACIWCIKVCIGEKLLNQWDSGSSWQELEEPRGKCPLLVRSEPHILTQWGFWALQPRVGMPWM